MYKPQRKEYERDIVSQSDAKLVEARDASVWTKDKSTRASTFKQEINMYASTLGNSVGYLKNQYLGYSNRGLLRANIHLTIGKERL